MPQATLTSKGRITIPKRVREALKLDVGGKVESLVLEDRDVLLHPVAEVVDDVFGKLHKLGRPSVSVARMDEAIRTRIRADKA
jgi:antitoxin PrlF